MRLSLHVEDSKNNNERQLGSLMDIGLDESGLDMRQGGVIF